ncbi:MAG: class I SAM-dependent methyltransferase [Planctomycetes bacterium]|nr:class I SAM-dependent methyltransferase [Planctomycetota bacterium]
MSDASSPPPPAWDYSAHAPHYDKRADYAGEAIDALLTLARLRKDVPIVDIGAGTGKLTRMLLARGFEVRAVEPNRAMRELGVQNTAGMRVTWSEGTGEETLLPAASFDLVTFGSSFNVTDRPRALREAARILAPRGWFACMWNHRDLDDPIQALCERTIRERIPHYDYGSRREDQTGTILESGLFDAPERIDGRTLHRVSVEDFVEGWRSHATLARQAGSRLEEVIAAISEELAGRGPLEVPYVTRVWCARLRELP